jgi:hypothetical protein
MQDGSRCRKAQDAGRPWMAMVEIFRFAQDAGWLRMQEGHGCRMVMVEIFRFAQDAGWLKMQDGYGAGCRKVRMQDGYGRDLSLRSRCRKAQEAGRPGCRMASWCRMAMVEIFRFAQDAGWLKMQEGQDAGWLW